MGPGRVIAVMVALGCAGCSCTSTTCAPNDFNCFLDHLSFAEGGQAVELVRVPESALWALLPGDGGAAADAPALLGTPSQVSFDGGWQDFSFNWTDPNGMRPAVCVLCRHATDDARPCGPKPQAACLRPKRDLLVAGHACAAVLNDAVATGASQFATSLVAVVDPTGARDATSVLTQDPLPPGLEASVPVNVTFTLPQAASSNSHGSGSCAGHCASNGDCGGPCSTNADCCAEAICVSEHFCIKDALSPNCQCDTLPTSGRCVDFKDFGVTAQQTALTECSNQVGCTTNFTFCCPGTVCVTFSGNAQPPQCLPASNGVCP